MNNSTPVLYQINNNKVFSMIELACFLFVFIYIVWSFLQYLTSLILRLSLSRLSILRLLELMYSWQRLGLSDILQMHITLSGSLHCAMDGCQYRGYQVSGREIRIHVKTPPLFYCQNGTFNHFFLLKRRYMYHVWCLVIQDLSSKGMSMIRVDFGPISERIAMFIY
jgi:hypothetical protein